MRRFIVLVSLLALGLFWGAQPAFADWGSYNDRNGVPCTYSGSGGMYTITCAGMAMPSGQYVSYSCTYMVFGQNSASWNCRSMDGASWSGSR